MGSQRSGGDRVVSTAVRGRDGAADAVPGVAPSEPVDGAAAEDPMRAVAEADPAERESRSAAAPSPVRAAYERMSGELSSDPWPCGGIWLSGRIPAESEVADAVDAGVEIEISARRTAIAAAKDADVKPCARRSDDQWGAAVSPAGTRPAIPRTRTKQPRGSIREVFESDAVGVFARIVALHRQLQLAQPVRVVPIAAAAWAGVELTPAHGPRLRARCPRCGLARSRQRERRDAGVGGQCEHRRVEAGPLLADVAGIGADRLDAVYGGRRVRSDASCPTGRRPPGCVHRRRSAPP